MSVLTISRGCFERFCSTDPARCHAAPKRNSIDYRIVPGSFPNPVVSWSVLRCRGRCRRRLDHGMVGCCVRVLLFTSLELHLGRAHARAPRAGGHPGLTRKLVYWGGVSIDSSCECEHNNPDSLNARLFPSVVLAVAPAVTMDEACFRSWYTRNRSVL